MNARPQFCRLVSLFMFSLALLMACTPGRQAKSLDLTLGEYEKMVRWSEWDGAAGFLSPAYLAEHPVSRLDLDRLRLFRVTAYTVRSTVPYDEGAGVRQTVEIRLFNRNRAVERALTDYQDWRYDPELERWFLHSGLPDVTRAR
jgi:hypothetical protein